MDPINIALLAICISILAKFYYFFTEIESNFSFLHNEIKSLDEKITILSAQIQSRTEDIQEQINDSKCEIIDTQDKLIKKNKKSLKIIKNEIEEVKNMTNDIEYPSLLNSNFNFEDMIGQSLKMLTKVLKGDDPNSIIEEINQNNTVINLSKVSEVFGKDMETLTEVYKMISNIVLELSEVSDTFFIKYNSKIKYRSEEVDADDYDHADYCPFCLTYDILTEMGIYEGIIEKILSYIKEYYLILKHKNLDHWQLAEEDNNLKLIFLYYKNLPIIIDECSTFDKIGSVHNNDLGNKMLDVINKMIGSPDNLISQINDELD